MLAAILTTLGASVVCRVNMLAMTGSGQICTALILKRDGENIPPFDSSILEYKDDVPQTQSDAIDTFNGIFESLETAFLP